LDDRQNICPRFLYALDPTETSLEEIERRRSTALISISITIAKIAALEAEALKIVITDKKTGDQAEEAVHCLICKQIVM
jgi:hypothetical protein